MDKRLKATIYIVSDMILVALAVVGGLWLCNIPFDSLGWKWLMLIPSVFFVIICNILFKLYTNLVKFAGMSVIAKVAASSFSTFFYCLVLSIVLEVFTTEWAIVTTFICIVLLSTSRLLPRFFVFIKNYSRLKSLSDDSVNVMVVGAGMAGDVLIREMKNSDKINMTPVCVIDDDKNKIGQYIDGIKVVGNTSKIVEAAKEYLVDEIIIAIPSVSKKRLSDIVKECKKTRCEVKVIPSVGQLATGEVTVRNIKDISIQDLLGREQIKVNLEEIMGYIEGKVVLVTGGGGSIGSELCRQIAEHNPKQLIIVDIYENNAYDIQQELERKNPNLNLLVLIASVRDSKKIDNIFATYRPHIVFHAAAHKHVPLMETSPNEAVKNNVSGTFKVADAAGRNATEKFILISTDKAVNPTNIMGATKRICEMIIQTMNKRYDTDYVAVRFGNVLGSNGSVVPLFRKQIEEGGPVTVTHKDIVRYFMTIPEAVSLVLQAGAYAKGGEIFVLDMGDPVRIYDLAENMIKLCGLEPNKDIDIKITGLRPGEKLYEERLMEEEGLKKTANDMISIGKPLKINEENLLAKVQELYIEAYNETDKMKELVHELVPTYKIDKRKTAKDENLKSIKTTKTSRTRTTKTKKQ